MLTGNGKKVNLSGKKYSEVFRLNESCEKLDYLDVWIISYLRQQNEYGNKWVKRKTIEAFFKLPTMTCWDRLEKLKDLKIYLEGRIASVEDWREWLQSDNKGINYVKIYFPSETGNLTAWDCIVWSFILSFNATGRKINKSYLAKVLHLGRVRLREIIKRLIGYELLDDDLTALLPEDKRNWILNSKEYNSWKQETKQEEKSETKQETKEERQQKELDAEIDALLNSPKIGEDYYF